MELTQIGVKYKRRFSMPDYESVEVEMYASASVGPDDDPEGAMLALREYCRNHAIDEAARVAPQLRKHMAQVRELFLGLPIEEQNAIREQEGWDADKRD